jgi:hypothetical protein
MISARMADIRAASVERAGYYLLLYAFVFPFAVSARSERSLDGELLAVGGANWSCRGPQFSMKHISGWVDLLTPKLFDLL